MRRRAFCIMSLRVAVSGEVKVPEARSRSESESEQGVQSGDVEKCSDELRVGVKG